MPIEIYHQIGHNSNWNFESIREDNTGDGIILASSHIEMSKVEALSQEIKGSSIFDPQFFIPNVQVRKLATYDFFPNRIGNGFITSEYLNGNCDECANSCVKFQIDNDFCKIIIPTRILTGMPTNFIREQQKLFVEPFLEAISHYSNSKPILLQLVVNDNMIKNQEYTDDLLNWITRIPIISGLYLIAEITPRPKQLHDIDFLVNYLRFINHLRLNDMYVLLGYQNTESILLSLANPNAITIGAYENLRMFNIRHFEDQTGQTTWGPNARIYLSKLTQWIDVNYIGAIQRIVGNSLFDINKYQAQMFQPTFRWHFTKPQLYKHYFLVFSEQIRNICLPNDKERFEIVMNTLETSMGNFEILRNAGLIFDQNSAVSHLAPWITVANLYAKEQGWRI